MGSVLIVGLRLLEVQGFIGLGFLLAGDWIWRQAIPEKDEPGQE